MRLRAAITTLAMPALLAAAGSQGLAQTKTTRPTASGGQRLSLTPHYSAGQVIRYHFENTMTSEERRGGAVSDPQGGGQLTLKWSAILRMEVLSLHKDAKGLPDGGMRVRWVYEKSAASVTSDTYDPASDAVAADYGALEGKAFEFTVNAAGQVTNVKGIDASGGKGNEDAMRSLLGQFSAGANAPHGGVAVGETWTTDLPFDDAPLAGLMWKIQSTYLRNEPCHSANVEGEQVPASGEMCAVILTKRDLTGSRAGRDATPESYRKQGLKTEGTLNASGDYLSYVELKDGLLVSLTQTYDQQMDLTISSQDGGFRKLIQGIVKSRQQFALIPPSNP